MTEILYDNYRRTKAFYDEQPPEWQAEFMAIFDGEDVISTSQKAEMWLAEN